MKKVLFYSICALALMACQKEAQKELPVTETKVGAPTTFTVVTPETKTTLNDHAIKWAAGDEIQVYGYSEGEAVGSATYELLSGAGSASAVFQLKGGESLAAYDTYYAVYPADKAITTASLPDKIVFASEMPMTQTAVENGYDPSYAIMTASYSAGQLVFTHGCAYIKLQVGLADVTDVKLTFGNNAIEAKPVYTASTGALTADGTHRKVVTVSGSFVQNSYYYIPVPARPSQNPGSITVEYTVGGNKSSKTTSSLSSVKLENGKVYDLGCPPVSFAPVITSSDVLINAGDTGGTINFTVTNLVAGGYVVKSVTSDGLANSAWADVAFNSSTGEGSVSFTCDANTDTTNPKTATVHLFYTTDGSTELDAVDVTVNQKKAGGASTSYTWNFSSTEFQTANSSNATLVLTSSASANSNTTITWTYAGTDMVFVANKTKYVDNTYLQMGGGGSASSRSFTFTAPDAGTLTINGCSNKSESRTLVVTLDGSAVSASSGGSSSSSSPSDHVYALTAGGTVVIYASGGDFRFYSIAYTN